MFDPGKKPCLDYKRDRVVLVDAVSPDAQAADQLPVPIQLPRAAGKEHDAALVGSRRRMEIRIGDEGVVTGDRRIGIHVIAGRQRRGDILRRRGIDPRIVKRREGGRMCFVDAGGIARFGQEPERAVGE